MKVVRNGRRFLGLTTALALAGLLGGERAVQAQPALCAEAKGGEGSTRPPFWALRLMAPWTEVENDWNGRWTPVRDRAGHYSAVWTKNGERVEADMQITPVDNSHVTIVRTQPNVTCTYNGTVWPEGWHVSGTYRCSSSGNRTMRWSAAIARGYQPTATRCGDLAPAPDPRLNVIWREQEGDWAGTWSPRQPAGDFRAGWHKGREWTNADLHITLDGERVTILRSQGQGICHYEGQFTGNGWHAAGTFYCSWHHERMPWSAVIGDGSPPAS